jgi:hypothetical protein
MPSAGAHCHERKYTVTPEQAARFLAAAGRRLQRVIFDPTQPVTFTRTTYLDTPDLALWRAGEQGPIARRLRVRQYAAAPDDRTPPTLTGDAWLEVKASSDGLRAKSRFPLDGDGLARALRGGKAIGDLERGLLRVTGWVELRPLLSRQDVAPRLATWYRRVSFETRGLRVTWDDGICFCRPWPALAGPAAPPDGHVVARYPFGVLEIKHRGRPPMWLVKALGALPAPSPLSKYHLGMRALRERSQAAQSSTSIAAGAPAAESFA